MNEEIKITNDNCPLMSKHAETPSEEVSLDTEDSQFDIEKPLCPYGYECLRKNAQHLKEFRHPNAENDDDMIEVKCKDGSIIRKRKTETYGEKWKKRRLVEEESIQKSLKIQKSYSLAARHLSLAIDPNRPSTRDDDDTITPARKSLSRVYLNEFIRRAKLTSKEKNQEPKAKPKIGIGFKPGEEFTL